MVVQLNNQSKHNFIIQTMDNSVSTVKGNEDTQVSVVVNQKLRDNKMLGMVVQFIVRHLRAEYQIKNYDGNIILRRAKQVLQGQPEGSEKQACLSIWHEIQLFGWNLAVCPKYWVIMFENQEFFSTQDQTIDMHVFTSKIYKFILNTTKTLTSYAELFSDLVSSELFLFYEEISIQICDNYRIGSEMITKQATHLEKLIKNSKIINFYFIYKLLSETSRYCEQKIFQEFSTSIFKNIQGKYCNKFTNYIIQKHEVLKLIFDKNSKPIKNKQETSLVNIIERIKNTKNLKWREAVREDGQSAIMVEFENQKDKDGLPENYMIKLDKDGKIKVLNCNTVRKKWTVTEAAQKNYDILNIVSDQGAMAKKLRNSPTQIKMIPNTYAFSTIGGSLGKCLADINQYDSVGDFVFDMSKKTIVGGTFNYVACRVPLVGILFVTGGFSYTMYGIFSNQKTNKKKKFQQVGYLTFDVASTVGTGLLGAVVGQALIPVPILGAFVGAFVGSFIGEIGGKAFIKVLQSMRFKKTIEQLQTSLQPAGYWQVNEQTLNYLNINKKTFYNTIPQQLQGRVASDKYWYAMIGFTILSFNQSKKRAIFMKNKMKEIEKKKETKFEEFTFDYVKNQLHYEGSVDLDVIMKYFENNRVNIISCFKELQEEVIKIFQLME